MHFETVSPAGQPFDPALLNQTETPAPRAKPRQKRPSSLASCNTRLCALGRGSERVERSSNLGEYSLVLREKLWGRNAWKTTIVHAQLDLEAFADELARLPLPEQLAPKVERRYTPKTRPAPKAKVKPSTLPLKNQIAAKLAKVLSRVKIVISMNGHYAIDAESIAQDVLAWAITNADKYDATRGTLLTPCCPSVRNLRPPVGAYNSRVLRS